MANKQTLNSIMSGLKGQLGGAQAAQQIKRPQAAMNVAAQAGTNRPDEQASRGVLNNINRGIGLTEAAKQPIMNRNPLPSVGAPPPPRPTGNLPPKSPPRRVSKPGPSVRPGKPSYGNKQSRPMM